MFLAGLGALIAMGTVAGARRIGRRRGVLPAENLYEPVTRYNPKR
jgi:hypothetical protein